MARTAVANQGCRCSEQEEIVSEAEAIREGCLIGAALNWVLKDKSDFQKLKSKRGLLTHLHQHLLNIQNTSTLQGYTDEKDTPHALAG